MPLQGTIAPRALFPSIPPVKGSAAPPYHRLVWPFLSRGTRLHPGLFFVPPDERRLSDLLTVSSPLDPEPVRQGDSFFSPVSSCVYSLAVPPFFSTVPAVPSIHRLHAA